jgi:hypothetical protein
MDGLRKDNVPGVGEGRIGCPSAQQVLRRVLIVSDIRILREGLAEVLAKDSSFAIVSTDGGLEEALHVAALQPAQIILVDAALPEGTTRSHACESCPPAAGS